jgi:hypothetical protein
LRAPNKRGVPSGRITGILSARRSIAADTA